jgi:hypothetical protein
LEIGSPLPSEVAPVASLTAVQRAGNRLLTPPAPATKHAAGAWHETDRQGLAERQRQTAPARAGQTAPAASGTNRACGERGKPRLRERIVAMLANSLIYPA